MGFRTFGRVATHVDLVLASRCAMADMGKSYNGQCQPSGGELRDLGPGWATLALGRGPESEAARGPVSAGSDGGPGRGETALRARPDSGVGNQVVDSGILALLGGAARRWVTRFL